MAIDFHGNYITNSHDNPIEADGSMHNIRIMRNMFINHASHAFCNQPTLGGPVYWIRNIAYHLPAGSTRLTNGAAGALFYNNTILSETAAAATSNSHWRNNLILGESALPAIFAVTTFTSYTSSDYNGFRPNPGAATSFEWNSPPPPVVAVDYDVFMKVPKLDAQDAATVQRLYDAKDLDFRLRAGSSAVDRGVVLPTITEGFTGRAPDLGALERDRPAPVYGPRPVAR